MTTRNCENCKVAYGPDDLFCENCGYDFVTGSLPTEADGAKPGPPTSGITASALPEVPSVLNEGTESSAQGAPESGVTAEADIPRVSILIAVDQAFFDEVVNDGEIEFPDPVPAEQELNLAGSEFHIGRTSDSRAIHPDIDVADLTNDQAVSSRHAVLRIADDGTVTIVDVGSTNGTFLDTVDSEALTHGIPFEVQPGSPIYVGAWTRLVVSK